MSHMKRDYKSQTSSSSAQQGQTDQLISKTVNCVEQFHETASVILKYNDNAMKFNVFI